MADDAEMLALAKVVAECQRGSVVAAAGCGKTELLAMAVAVAKGRRLVLTHTHAGVDALKQRFKLRKVPSSAYVLDTIAGWSLRYATSFPVNSGIHATEPKSAAQWSAVYAAAAKLVRSGAIDAVLTASYEGVLVDEYQDCNGDQHALLLALSKRLPTCVVGDELQAIFDFKGQVPVNWEEQVYPAFPVVGKLDRPHRWLNAGNIDLAAWLDGARKALAGGKVLDLRSDALNYVWLPDQPGPRSRKIVATAQAAMKLEGRVLIIADAANEGHRAKIAENLAKQGFSTIEPVSSKTLMSAATAMQAAADGERLVPLLSFLSKCMSGVRPAQFQKAVASLEKGGRAGRATYGLLISLGIKVDQIGGLGYALPMIEGFEQLAGTHTYRQEMLSAMKSALRMQAANPGTTLADAAWQVQNRMRHIGRRIPYRCIGSTLLVKGLEFDHVIVVESKNMSCRDWYVALTRGTKSLTVLASTNRFFVGN